MPELPEVETVVRGLQKPLVGHAIKSVTLTRAGLRIPFPKGLPGLRRVKIQSVTRRAKYILMTLDNTKSLIIHLGMSGRMTVGEKQTRQKHDHMILTLESGQDVVFNDARRFGLVDLVPTDALDKHRFFVHLGPEPLSSHFTSPYLAKKLSGKKTAIKTAIMDQRIVVGIGNIYASEALSLARIHPVRLSNTLTVTEVKTLTKAIKATLEKAIKAGGSSLRDYVQADGTLGYFQHNWRAYDKAGKACPWYGCQGIIEKITQAGRSTFFCATCQK